MYDMIGLVLVAHGGLAKELLRTAGVILGKTVETAVGVTIDAFDDPEKVSSEIHKAVKSVDQGDGVVIFTDMFGGTPSNIALSFLQLGRVEVISGVNLPMVLHICTNREGQAMSRIAETLQLVGREQISLASDILRGKG